MLFSSGVGAPCALIIPSESESGSRRCSGKWGLVTGSPKVKTDGVSVFDAAEAQLAEALGSDRFYSTRIRQLARLDISETEAARLWRRVAQHRRALLNKLGR